jgi:hypothetical protein
MCKIISFFVPTIVNYWKRELPEKDVYDKRYIRPRKQVVGVHMALTSVCNGMGGRGLDKERRFFN